MKQRALDRVWIEVAKLRKDDKIELLRKLCKDLGYPIPVCMEREGRKEWPLVSQAGHSHGHGYGG